MISFAPLSLVARSSVCTRAPRAWRRMVSPRSALRSQARYARQAVLRLRRLTHCVYSIMPIPLSFPGWRGADVKVPETLIKKFAVPISAVHAFCTICSGVFVLAAAGILDGKRVTTHWRYAKNSPSVIRRFRLKPMLCISTKDKLLLGGLSPQASICSCWYAKIMA